MGQQESKTKSHKKHKQKFFTVFTSQKNIGLELPVTIGQSRWSSGKISPLEGAGFKSHPSNTPLDFSPGLGVSLGNITILSNIAILIWKRF